MGTAAEAEVLATDFKIAMHLSDSGMDGVAVANRERMVRVYHAIEAGDDAAMVPLLHPDIRFYEAPSLPYGIAAVGIEATLRGVGGMLAAWSRIRVEIDEFAAAGDLVIAYMRFTGTARHTGRVYDGVCAEVFRFAGGLITEWRPIYWDTHAARKACLEADQV